MSTRVYIRLYPVYISEDLTKCILKPVIIPEESKERVQRKVSYIVC